MLEQVGVGMVDYRSFRSTNLVFSHKGQVKHTFIVTPYPASLGSSYHTSCEDLAYSFIFCLF